MFDNMDRDSYMEARKQKELFMKKLIIGGSVGVILLVFGLILFINSHTIIQPGYKGVQFSLNGGIKEEELGQGWNWHSPFVNVYPYPVSTEIEKRELIKDEDSKIIEDLRVQFNTGDGKSVTVSYTYSYHMQSGKLGHIFTKFRKQPANVIAKSYIDQQILNVGQAVTTEHGVLEVYAQKRAEINQEIFDRVKKILAEDGIVFEKFTINDVVPDKNTLQILQQIADEENNRELVKRQRATLKEQNLNIEQQKTNELLAAQKDKEIAKVNAEKKAEVRKIEAAGEAEANREIAKSVTPELTEYIKWNRWDGKFPTHMLGDDTGVILGNK